MFSIKYNQASEPLNMVESFYFDDKSYISKNVGPFFKFPALCEHNGHLQS